jgi:hypothetical protein
VTQKVVVVRWRDDGQVDVQFDTETVEPNDLVGAAFLLERIANRILDSVEQVSVKEPTLVHATQLPHENGAH